MPQGGRRYFRRPARGAILLTLAWGVFAHAQEFGSPGTLIVSGAPVPGPASQEETTKNTSRPCLEPPPLLSWEDYRGPFQKVVGAFARKLELKAVRPPRYKPGTVLCSLDVKDKFALFVRDTFDPISFFEAAFDAGLDQESNRDHTFGQGARSYGRRFGADFAGSDDVEVFYGFCVSNDLLGGPAILPPH
jgi:hypothetical protein